MQSADKYLDPPTPEDALRWVHRAVAWERFVNAVRSAEAEAATPPLSATRVRLPRASGNK